MAQIDSMQSIRQRRAVVTPARFQPLDRSELEDGADKSPAVALRKRIADDLDAGQSEQEIEGRWGPGATILFSVGSALVLWALIAIAIYFLA